MDIKFKRIICIIIGIILAPIIGNWIAEESYFKIGLFFIIFTTLILLPVMKPSVIMAFGFSAPILIPIPIIQKFPLIFICLCCAFFIRIISDSREGAIIVQNYRIRIDYLVIFFFGWVLMRYLLDPVVPRHLSGQSEDVSGFLAYFKYFCCLLIFLLLPIALRTKDEINNFLKWSVIISIIFGFIFLVASFANNLLLNNILNVFGIFTVGGSGTVRIIMLPFLGLHLVSLSLYWRILNYSRLTRTLLLGIGLIFILFGAGRLGVLQLIVVIFSTSLFLKKYRLFYSLTILSIIVLISGHFIGENVELNPEFKPVRLLSIVSPKIASLTDASDNNEWRKDRWKSAVEGILEKPFIGYGYGNLKGIFGNYFNSAELLKEAKVQLSLASGETHNALLSAAFSLGIPSVILFLLLYFKIFYKTCCKIYAENNSYANHLFAWISCYLLSTFVSIQGGGEFNNTRLWFLITMAVIISHLDINNENKTEETIFT